jgi:hypothetical protein
MIQSFKAVIEPDGRIQLGPDIKLEKSHRAIVTILDEPGMTYTVPVKQTLEGWIGWAFGRLST